MRTRTAAVDELLYPSSDSNTPSIIDGGRNENEEKKERRSRKYVFIFIIESEN